MDFFSSNVLAKIPNSGKSKLAREVGFFLDSTKNHNLYKPAGPELRKLMIQPFTKYAFGFE
jgi:hypothetical protein